MAEEQDNNQEQEAQEPKYTPDSVYQAPENKTVEDVQVAGGASEVLETKDADVTPAEMRAEAEKVEPVTDAADRPLGASAEPLTVGETPTAQTVMYVGPRPILPQQSTDMWVRPSTGKGEYSNWQLNSPVHLLDGMPIKGNHEMGTGVYNPVRGGRYLSDIYKGGTHTSPQAYKRFSPYGQQAPELRDPDKYEFRGMPSAEIFPTKTKDWGHDGTRVTTTSIYVGWSAGDHAHDGVPSAIQILGGQPRREWTESLGGHDDPLLFNKGVPSATPVLRTEDVGNGTHESKYRKLKEWQGVPSAKVL